MADRATVIQALSPFSVEGTIVRLQQQGWRIDPAVLGGPDAPGTEIYHLVGPALHRGRPVRHIFNADELVDFGRDQWLSDMRCAPVEQRLADPLDVVDWHGDQPAPYPLTVPRQPSPLLFCMALLGLCLAVLALVGAAEVLDDVTTLYRNLHP